MNLSEKLLYLRKKNGLSQEQLASEITVSRQAISKWELGESMPDTENVVQLTKIFDVSTDFLLNDEVDIPISTGSYEGTEEEIISAMLKSELKDETDKLAAKMYEGRKKKSKNIWLPILWSVLVVAAIVTIYFLFFR